MKILMFLIIWVVIYTVTNILVTRRFGHARGETIATVVSGVYGLAVLLYLLTEAPHD